MKTKILISVAILAAVVLAASMVLARGLAQEYSGQKWEYLFISYDLHTGTSTAMLSDETASQVLSANLAALKLPPLVPVVNSAVSTLTVEEQAALAAMSVKDQPDPRNIAVVFTHLGQQGWELTSTISTLFIFKRPTE